MIVYNVPVMAAPNEPEEFEDDLIEEISSSVSKLDGNEDTTWQEDFEYTISGENIVLRKYKGSATELTIPSKAKINGVEYSVKLNDDCNLFFYNCYSLKKIMFANIDTSNVNDMDKMFYGCGNLRSVDLSAFNTVNVRDMSDMFAGCQNLTSLDLNSFNTSSVTNMSGMFRGCRSISTLDVSNFDTRNVTDMSGMFGGWSDFGCDSLQSLDLSNFDTTKVTNMDRMFNCSSMTYLNVSSFDTSNVYSMYHMFGGCKSLKKLDLSSFDTSKVSRMSSMFYNCMGLTNLDLSSFNTSNVYSMDMMFYGCSGLSYIVLGSFDTSSVNSMSSMFSGCSSLESLDLSSFNMCDINNSSDMISCKKLQEIKIPINLERDIKLPGTFIKKDNPEETYTYLPKNQTASFTIVKAVPVTGISVSPTQINLFKGDEYSLSAIITPSNATIKDVVWSSDNPTIASVDDEGKVTGVSEGSTNIKVKTVDGEKVATCYVTVSPIKHSYKNPVFQWSSDSKSCKVTYTCDGISCKTGSKHTVTYDCDVTSEVLSLPTCSKKGITRYTATYGTDSDTKTIKDIPATDNHDFDYDNPEFNWSKDRKSCTVTYYCKNDMSHTVTYDCDVTSEVVTPATCENKGTTKYTATYNGITNTKVVKDIPKTAHTCENVITKATATKDGRIEQVCTECDEVIKTTKINKIESMSLSLSKATYTGKAIQPTVTVLDSSGKIIAPDYYTVKYINNTNVGTATVKVVFKKLYKGSLSKTFTIIPKKTLITAASSPKKGSMKVTWNKQATETTGYEIQVSPVTNFKKNVKTVNVAKPAAKAKTITGLKKGKNYVRIRTYKIVNGTKYYSAWSKYGKAVTVK